MFRRRPRAGPTHQDQLSVYFEALGHLRDADLLRLRAVWKEAGREAHEKAWAEVRAVGERDGLSREIGKVRDRAVAWAQRGTNRPAPFLADDRYWTELKIEASEAIVDAALAIALGDRLDGQTSHILMGPWLSVRPDWEDRA
jgi:hypothetical protein